MSHYKFVLPKPSDCIQVACSLRHLSAVETAAADEKAYWGYLPPVYRSESLFRWEASHCFYVRLQELWVKLACGAR